MMKQMTEIKVKENPSRKSITVDKDSDPKDKMREFKDDSKKNLQTRAQTATKRAPPKQLGVIVEE